MVSIQVLTQKKLALNIWLITGIAIMLIRDGSVNGQLSNGRNAADYGPANGNTPSGGAGGEGVNNGEVLLAKTSPLNGQEPTCEELRAMWRFSKRQSRAAEVTNEIPTYRDPFAYNIWEPYIATTRSIGGVRLSPRYRDSGRPVYGRILHREPLAALVDRNRGAMDDYTRGSAGYGLVDSVGASSRIQSTEPRRRIQFRFAGYGPGGTNTGGGNAQNLLTAHHGSFQKLKELIWTERARELATQRKAEELAARAAVLKDIANGQNFALRRQLQQQQQQQQNADNLADENRNPDMDHFNGGIGSIVALPGAQKSSVNAPGKQSLGHGVANNMAGSLRSGGVHFPIGSAAAAAAAASSASAPSHTIGQLRTYGYRQPGASIFRERNRALYRQALASQPLPADYYQRDLRTDSDSDDDSGSDSDSDIDFRSVADDLIDNNSMLDAIIDDNTDSAVDRDISYMPFSRNIANYDAPSWALPSRRSYEHHGNVEIRRYHQQREQHQTPPSIFRDRPSYEEMKKMAEQQSGVRGRYMYY